MYFKIYNNLSALPSNYLPRDNSIRTYYSRKKCGYLIQSFCRTQLFANDFLNRCVHCFNSLSESVILERGMNVASDNSANLFVLQARNKQDTQQSKQFAASSGNNSVVSGMAAD